MQFIIKFFPEITIKSKPVRKQFVKALRTNLRILLKPLDPEVDVQSDWDRMLVSSQSDDESLRLQMVEILSCTPGIAHFLDVKEFPYVDMHDAFEKTASLWGDRLAG